MRIKVHRIVEDLAGFLYRYDLFEFESGGIQLVARSYLSTPEEAHFLRKEVDGEQFPLEPKDLESDLFSAAASHLRTLGKTDLNYLSLDAGGYVPLAY